MGYLPRMSKLAGIVLFLLFCACGGGGPDETPNTETSATAEPAPGANAEADATATLQELTQTLRKYSAEKQRVPASLQELVAAGYLPAIPAAPPGRQFAIDTKQVQVVLTD